MDNPATPDVVSGHGSSTPTTPDTSSGYGTNVNSSNVDNQTQNNNQPQTDWKVEFEKQRNASASKITELGQRNSEFQARLDQMTQAQEAQKQALGQAFGFTQPQEQVDYFQQFAQNPNSIIDLIEQKAKQMAEQQVAPWAEKITRSEVQEYLNFADNEKTQIKQELLNRYDPKIVEQVCDFTDVVNPRINQLNAQLSQTQANTQEAAKLQSQLYTELANEIQRQGGVQKMIDMKLGQYTRQNFEPLMKSAAQIYQQKAFQAARSKPIPTYSGGAATQQSGPSFGTNVNSESVYR